MSNSVGDIHEALRELSHHMVDTKAGRLSKTVHYKGKGYVITAVIKEVKVEAGQPRLRLLDNVENRDEGGKRG